MEQNLPIVAVVFFNVFLKLMMKFLGKQEKVRERRRK